jgi:glycosyltransferase involved in cell wall biosynthesis
LTRLHVAVLSASRWSGLEGMDTRWRRVVQAWREDPRIDRLTVVDLPWFTSPATPPTRLLRNGRSWLDGTDLLELKVPSGQFPRLDAVAWRRVARRLRSQLSPSTSDVLVVGATPVSAPLLTFLPDAKTAFDAVDVWRMRAVGGAHPARIAAGYSAGVRADRVSCVSATLQSVLLAEGARDVAVIPNGVSLAEFRNPVDMPLPDLPEGRFAVYIGTVGQRLDFPMMRQVWGDSSALPLVLVGPAADEEHQRLARQGPWSWVGRVTPEAIPALLARATIAVLPQRDTEITEAQDYMKLFQYLASGIPIAATPLPGMPEDVWVGADAGAFRVALEEAAKSPRRTTLHPALVNRDWADVAERLLTHYLS